jgi:hypothetical protein
MFPRLNYNNEVRCFLRGPYQGVINGTSLVSEPRVEAGSNTSTVALRVVGGDEKGSLESETVKYVHEYHWTQTRELLCRRGPAAVVNNRSILSSERERPTSTNPQLSFSSKNLTGSPRWVLYSKTDRPTDRRS